MIISDYRVREERTGAEVILALRSEHGAQAPAFLVTGATGPERLREAHRTGLPLLHRPLSPLTRAPRFDEPPPSACWFRSFSNFLTAVLFRCGGLDLYPAIPSHHPAPTSMRSFHTAGRLRFVTGMTTDQAPPCLHSTAGS